VIRVLCSNNTPHSNKFGTQDTNLYFILLCLIIVLLYTVYQKISKDHFELLEGQNAKDYIEENLMQYNPADVFQEGFPSKSYKTYSEISWVRFRDEAFERTDKHSHHSTILSTEFHSRKKKV